MILFMKLMWIHEQPKWPCFTWDSQKLSPKLAALRHRQGRLLGRLEGLGFDLRSEASLNALTSDVVTSAAIEGESLNSEEVRSSIARRLGMDVAGLPPASRAVEGMVEMMLDATQRYAEPLTEDRLFGWHAALFPIGRSGLRRITVGGWRPAEADPMQVVSGPMGKETVHFQAPSGDSVEKEMRRFLCWFDEEGKLDPVLKAGVAHLWFITVHPFEDGNGRIARAITDMALARADASPDRFYSLSTQIEAERKDYYDQLQAQQRDSLDITGWLEWFLACSDRALTHADTMLASVLLKANIWKQLKKGPVHERQKLVINRMLQPDFKGFMNTSKYAKLAHCSPDTALRDIQDLLEKGVLVNNSGGGRSTSYRLALR